MPICTAVTASPVGSEIGPVVVAVAGVDFLLARSHSLRLGLDALNADTTSL